MQSTSFTGKEILELVKDTIVNTRSEVYYRLVTEYKLEEKKARNLEEQIAISVRNRQRSNFMFSSGAPLLKMGPYSSLLEKCIKDYPDFVNWVLIALNVIFYQSIGDTIGYRNGRWEFNHGNPYEGPEYVNELLYEYIDLGGINELDTRGWLASDDTILYLATFEVLISGSKNFNQYGTRLKKAYMDAVSRMKDRDPGFATMESLKEQKKQKTWKELAYNRKVLGNGSTMRSGSIGVIMPGSTVRGMLVALAVESSRITHNSAPTILGAITAAFFTSLALEREPINLWPRKLLDLIDSDLIDNYLKESRPEEYEFYARDRILFTGQWEKYLDLLFIGPNPRLDLKIMVNAVQRYKYLSENFSKDCDITGGCAHDSLIMAYDALVRCGGNLDKLIVYSILHPGDSDTVGSLAFSWFGAYYHSPSNERLISRFKDNLEYRQLIENFTIKCIPILINAYFYGIYMSYAKVVIEQHLQDGEPK